VQKVVDPVWQSEVERIYKAYTIYYQSNGTEQAVFEEGSGQASLRSERLLKHLWSQVRLPEAGRLLDIGCGNGALLCAFSRLTTRWSLVGTELNDKYRSVIENIPQVEGFYTCLPDRVPGTFRLITMVHVLEHIPASGDFLARIRHKLEYDGLLVIEVPDYKQNPFDLLIADHCTHFSATALTDLVQSAGYDVISVSTDWIPKELTLVARKVEQPQHIEQEQKIWTHREGTLSVQSVLKNLQWLESVVTTAREYATLGSFGIFGTSIAATWLFSELENSDLPKPIIQFFVDEDPHRTGKTYLGYPVYHPREVPKNSQVFIALPTTLAELVRARMEASGFDFHYHVPLPICYNAKL
jgi:SAM-dependent methyltransferase